MVNQDMHYYEFVFEGQNKTTGALIKGYFHQQGPDFSPSIAREYTLRKLPQLDTVQILNVIEITQEEFEKCKQNEPDAPELPQEKSYAYLLVIYSGGSKQVRVIDKETWLWLNNPDRGFPDELAAGEDENRWNDRVCPLSIRKRIWEEHTPLLERGKDSEIYKDYPVYLTAQDWQGDRAVIAPRTGGSFSSINEARVSARKFGLQIIVYETILHLNPFQGTKLKKDAIDIWLNRVPDLNNEACAQCKKQNRQISKALCRGCITSHLVKHDDTLWYIEF